MATNKRKKIPVKNTTKASKLEAAKATAKLGDAHVHASKLGNARVAYAKALDIYITLATESSLADYLEELASLCDKLGDVCYKEHDFESAADAYVLAREMYGRLAEESTEHLLHFIHTNGQLGRTYHCMGRYDDAEEAYLLADEACEELKDIDPTYYAANKADVAHCLGDLYRDMGLPDVAEVEYLREIKLAAELADLGPSIILPQLIDAYTNLATFYLNHNQPVPAATMNTKAKEAIAKLAALPPDNSPSPELH